MASAAPQQNQTRHKCLHQQSPGFIVAATVVAAGFVAGDMAKQKCVPAEIAGTHFLHGLVAAIIISRSSSTHGQLSPYAG